MTNPTYWLVLGPILVIAALALWLLVTNWAGRGRSANEPDDQDEAVEPPPRGEVSGGIIHGEASTMSRRDEAPRHDLPPRGDQAAGGDAASRHPAGRDETDPRTPGRAPPDSR